VHGVDPAPADALTGELLAATTGRTALIVTHCPEPVPGLREVRLGEAGTFVPAPRARTRGSSTV
jgi:hypothetical protein